jgi:hypothetical protein
MKNLISHKAKALTVGAVLFGLLTTGCSAHKDDNNPGIQATPSATATAEASATPEPTVSSTAPTEWADMNPEQRIDSTVAHADPKIAENFKLTPEQLKAVYVQGNDLYQDLTGTYNFKVARPEGSPADSAIIADQFQDSIAGTYIDTLKSQLDSQAPFPTANRDGSIATVDGVKYFIAEPASPADIHKVWVTAINRPDFIYTEMKDSDKGDGPTHGVQVKGQRIDYVKTTAGTVLKVSSDYSYTQVPGKTNTDFLLAGMGCITQSIKFATADELGQVFPNE